MKINLPYGKGYQALDIDDAYDVEILRPKTDMPGHSSDTANSSIHGVGGVADTENSSIRGTGGVADTRLSPGDRAVLNALASPIGSPRLSELARGARDAVVICSDHTRPVPSKNIIPHILAELRARNPDIKVTLLIATGMHRAPTRDELERKFGPEIVNSENIVIHDSKDFQSMIHMGRLPSGAELIINRVAAETGLLVAEGFIEPHFFAGFSGGRKAVLPGICSYETVLGNHCSAFIADPAARTGVLDGNPIHIDMLAARRMAGLAFIVNVIIDGEKNVLKAFAGDPEAAHRAGCNVLAPMCRVSTGRPADIVITTNGGAPLDLNIYQAVKSMTAAEAAAAPGAVIIALSECGDGAGGDSFMEMMDRCESPAALYEAILRTPPDKTAEDQWQAQILSRILTKHEVILVCSPKSRDTARRMKLHAVASADEAMALALEILQAGKTAAAAPVYAAPRITVIPDGVSVIVDPGGTK